jgi:tungstate transport system permease protein
MDVFSSSLLDAAHMIADADPTLVRIVGLSLRVSLSALVIATVVGAPLGALIAIGDFPGRRALTILLNSLMGLPPVVAGLLVYLLLSRAGPLGNFGILFTPTAMIVAQAVLITPIIAALTRQIVESAWDEYGELFASLRVTLWQSVCTLLWDTRFALVTVLLAGFGRAMAEVGAVIIVGGNIDGVTRVMTTAIALETSKGNLPLALALGMILMVLVTIVNALAFAMREWSELRHG